MLKVLVWCPSHDGSPAGGHQIQAAMTVDALNKSDKLHAILARQPDVDLAGFDIVHAFAPDLGQARRVRMHGIPLVLSTIYCAKEYRNRGPGSLSLAQEALWRLRSSAGAVRAGMRGKIFAKAEAIATWVIETRALYECADHLLPNSLLEGEAIARELSVSTPYSVVPNAVSPELFPPVINGARVGVLMAGRIEPHKNQLSLIRACRSLQVPLTIVGSVHPDHADYAARCRKEASSIVRILGARDHGQLSELYAGAQVHALPTYFETTGLANLEAALTGCSIVSTNRGYALEYFGEEAHYCNPASVSSISKALVEALNKGSSSLLPERILQHFTWAQTAQATIAAYEDVLGRR